MVRAWRNYIQGVVRVEVSGIAPERFFNLLGAAGIEAWDLVWRDGGISCLMALPGFWRIKSFARKAHVRVRVTERRGLPFFLKENRKRKLYAFGFASFFFMLYVLSLFLWDISFSGNYRYTADTLNKFLDSQGIACGILKSRVDCEELEEAIRTYFPEITWVSAGISGTRLMIQVKENEAISVVEPQDETPCDLVAETSGTIKSLIVRSGVPQVSVGDAVEEGQVLVSGVLPVTNDSEEVVAEHRVRADADIVAETAGSYRQSFPLLTSVTVDTGIVRNGFFLSVGPHTVRFLLPGREGSAWRTTMEERQLKLFSDFYLPVWWGRIRSRECVSYERYYTEEELNAKAQAIHQNFLRNLEEKGVQIIENNVKIRIDETLCHVEGSYRAQGPIGVAQTIREEENRQEGVNIAQ